MAGDTNFGSDIFVHDTLNRTTTRVSVGSDGSEANNYSSSSSMSADGRFVAFFSSASNLVTGDTNGRSDMFVRDTLRGTTTRVSVANDGSEGNYGSYGYGQSAFISADGRFVAFGSRASNLVVDDTNGVRDIFIRDTLNGATTRVSVANDGGEANSGSYNGASISADGRFIAFGSGASNLVEGDTNSVVDVYVRDTLSGTTTRVSVANDGSEGNSGDYIYGRSVSLSADGRFVAFASLASNLVDGDANFSQDVFVRDTLNGTTTRVSVANDGSEANGSSQIASISADGSHVAFRSFATNLVDGDTNGTLDVFLVDLTR